MPRKYPRPYRLRLNYDSSLSGFAFSWIRNGDQIALDSLLEHPVTEPGEYWVEVLDSNNCSKTSNSIFVLALGADQPEIGLVIGPNPFDDKIMIAGLIGIVDFKLTNSMGQLLKSGTFRPNTPYFRTEDLPAGSYYLTLISEGESKTFSLIK